MKGANFLMLVFETSWFFYCITVVASGPNAEILQFDWFISGWIFSVLTRSGQVDFKMPCLCQIKIKNLDKI